jgi:hypothetical protein
MNIHVALTAPALKILGFRWFFQTPYPTFYQVETLMVISNFERTTHYLETELPRFEHRKCLILTGDDDEPKVIRWFMEHKDSNTGLKRLSYVEAPIGVPVGVFGRYSIHDG